MESPRAATTSKTAGDDLDLLMKLIGHDLRGPLNVVALASELLDTMQTPPPQQLISRLRRATERINSLIDEISHFARARFGDGIETSTETMRIDKLVDRATQRVAETHPDREVSLDITPAEALFDPERIEKALVALLRDRLDAAEHVALEARTGDGVLTLAVRDDGAPVDPESLTTPSRKWLSIFLAAEIARVHGGTADLETGDSGNTLTLRLPT